MLFLQSIIQVIVGAAVLRTLPVGTILRSSIAGSTPYRFCGIDGGKVLITLCGDPRWCSPAQTQRYSIEYAATNWTIDVPSAVKAVAS